MADLPFPLRFPAGPHRVYVIDALTVIEYSLAEIISHKETARELGVAWTGWTHRFKARWHAEDDGVSRFGATLEEAFRHSWGTPETQALTRVKDVMLPHIDPPPFDEEEDDDFEFDEEDA